MTRLRVALAALSAACAISLGATVLTNAQPASSVPTPQSSFGFAACADRKLATYEQIADYFRALDTASERLQLEEIGTSVGGRPMVMAVISSEANLKDVARYKGIAQRLARAKGLTDEQARALAREGKAVMWVDFGLHSSELAHAQTAPEFAYRVVSEESDEMRFIRDNVILVLVPNMNPDGTTLWADWYMKHVGGPFERSSLPELYHHYIGHDNNRDWFMMTQPETRAVARQLYEQWYPQIIHNQHQSAPFPARIFIPPFEDPMNPNIPPLVQRGVNLVGEAMGRRFEQEGKPGAISRITFDVWWNGGMRTAPYFHNMIGILTETGHTSPAPATYDAKNFPRTFSNGVATLEPSTSYPNPYRGGTWHFRDSCEYMMTASMAVLDLGARWREQWLYDIYQMGRDAIRAGRDETYVVPAGQWDPGTAAKMINTLRIGGVEVERATASFNAGRRSFGAGSYLIRGAQAFRPYVTDLLNPQVYPDLRLYPDGPPERPYDVTGWTLPMQMGVEVHRLAEAVSVATEPIDRAPVPAGAVSGVAKAAYAIDPRANDAFVAVNRLLKAGDHVTRATAAFEADGKPWAAGTFLVTARGTQTHDRLVQHAAALGLQVTALDTPPSVTQTPLRAPRIGLYHAWGGNMDEGWTRWLLEQYEFPYTRLHDKDIRAGNLRARFDVIVLPDATYESMMNGLAPGSMPEDYVGGMTPHGVNHLYTFTQAGGTLVTLDSAASLPLTAFGLPIRNVAGEQPGTNFYIPGTLVRLVLDPTHPVAWGMPEQAAGFFAHSAAFQAGRGRSRFDAELGVGGGTVDGVHTVASYAGKDLLMSGWLLGDRVIANRAAVIDATVGQGRVVLIGFRAQHRAQPHATFKLLFNSLLLPVPPPPASPAAAPRR